VLGYRRLVRSLGRSSDFSRDKANAGHLAILVLVYLDMCGQNKIIEYSKLKLISKYTVIAALDIETVKSLMWPFSITDDWLGILGDENWFPDEASPLLLLIMLSSYGCELYGQLPLLNNTPRLQPGLYLPQRFQVPTNSP
jgi:hypothetical protein